MADGWDSAPRSAWDEPLPPARGGWDDPLPQSASPWGPSAPARGFDDWDLDGGGGAAAPRVPRALKVAAAVVALFLVAGFASFRVLGATHPVSISASYGGPASAGIVVGADPSALEVLALYPDGSERKVSGWECTTAALEVGGVADVRVTYGDLSCILSVECDTEGSADYKASCRQVFLGPLCSKPGRYDGERVWVEGYAICVSGSSFYLVQKPDLDDLEAAQGASASDPQADSAFRGDISLYTVHAAHVFGATAGLEPHSKVTVWAEVSGSEPSGAEGVSRPVLDAAWASYSTASVELAEVSQ